MFPIDHDSNAIPPVFFSPTSSILGTSCVCTKYSKKPANCSPCVFTKARLASSSPLEMMSSSAAVYAVELG